MSRAEHLHKEMSLCTQSKPHNFQKLWEKSNIRKFHEQKEGKKYSQCVFQSKASLTC